MTEVQIIKVQIIIAALDRCLSTDDGRVLGTLVQHAFEGFAIHQLEDVADYLHLHGATQLAHEVAKLAELRRQENQ